MVAEPDLVGSERVTQPAGPRQRLCAVERGIPGALPVGNKRIVSRDRRGVVSLPRQCPSKGNSSLRLTRLLIYIAPVKGHRFVESVVPRAERSKPEYRDRRW